MLVLVVLTVVAVADIIVVSQSSGSAIIATRLDEKPDNFFVIEDPDSYFLQAISNEGEPVFLGVFGNTKIDELITLHNTGNVVYLDEFYFIGRLSVDAFGFGPYLLQVIFFVGWALLITYSLTLLFNRAKPGKRVEKHE